MRSRLDKYNDNSNQKQIKSRLAKNKYLYDDLNNKIGFEELVDFNTQTRIELTSLNEAKKSRESYQQLKDYQELLHTPSVEPVEEKEEEKEKIFDINMILEEARKNRNEVDELEEKRKLKNEEYNILADLNKKYLSKEENQVSQEKEEYEGLEELIHTITSKTLASDINEQKEEEKEKDLLSDLIATSIDLQVKEPSQHENIEKQEVVSLDEETQDEKQLDNSFYTKSMDLSNQDLEFDDIKEAGNGKRVVLILLVIIVLLIVIGVVAYFIFQNMGIHPLEWISKK